MSCDASTWCQSTDKSMSENKENKTQAKRLKDAGKLNSLNPVQIQKHFILLHIDAIFCIGISVRISGEADKLMHHKFCLIDGTSAKGALITGSLNWTYTVCFQLSNYLAVKSFNNFHVFGDFQGLSKNCENVTFINSYRVKLQFRDAFDLIWNKYSKPYYPRSIHA